jgi:hypothetical protein
LRIIGEISMKKLASLLSAIFLVCFFSVGLIACKSECTTEHIEDWVAPMLAFNIHADKCLQGTFVMRTHRELEVDTLGRVVTENVTTSANLGANAVRATARFDYRGSQEWNVRFRVAVSRINWLPATNISNAAYRSITRANASIVAGVEYSQGADLNVFAGNANPVHANHLAGATNPNRWYFNRPNFVASTDEANTRAVEIPAGQLSMVILAPGWSHPNMLINHSMTNVATNQDVLVLLEGTHERAPALWNIRQANFGGVHTGGIADIAADIPATFLINKNTAHNYASQDFFIVGLTPGRYVVSYFMTVTDCSGHWHNFNVLAYTSSVITVSDINSPWL